MIRKLRQKRKWSQEQVAIMCGLSVRTIQRIESGNKASLESLKSLASVFEVSIEKLQEEITMIDKSSEEWKARPWWLRFNFIGINKRKDLILIETICFVLAVIFWIDSIFYRPHLLTFTPLLFLCAYMCSWLIRKGDEESIW